METEQNAESVRPFTWPGPGRLDSYGVEWWACDPYPTWYRWEGDKLWVRGRDWDDPFTTVELNDGDE